MSRSDIFGEYAKVKYFNCKHSRIPPPLPPLPLCGGAPGSGSPQSGESVEAARTLSATPREGSSGRGAGTGCQRRDQGAGAMWGSPRGRDILHLDEPAEDAEEPVFAVDGASYAVSPGALLSVLVRTR